jgi:hypothetical protein
MKKILFITLLTATLLSSCNNEPKETETITVTNPSPVAAPTVLTEQIKMADLKIWLKKLQDKTTKWDYFGITSNKVDCIYFIKAEDTFVIDYEIMNEEQKPYLQKMKEFGEKNKYEVVIATNNNTPNYESDAPAPLLRLKTHTSLEKTAEIASMIESSIFNNTSETVYTIIP